MPTGTPTLLRGSNKASSNSATSLAVTLPPGSDVGDFAICFAAQASTITLPSGWTVLYNVTGGTWTKSVFYKTLGSGDGQSGTVTVTMGSASECELHIVVLVGGPGGGTGGIRENQTSASAGSLSTSSGVLSTDSLIFFATNHASGSAAPTITPGSGALTILQSSSTTNSGSVLAVEAMPGGVFGATYAGIGADGWCVQIAMIGVAATGLGIVPAGSGAVSSLTTTGTSGAATLSGGVLNIPVYPGGSSSFSPYPSSLTPPVSTNFTWTNQGSATVADKTGRMVLSIPTQLAQLRGLLSNSSLPSTPYTIDLAVSVSGNFSGDIVGAQIILKNTGGAPLITAGLEVRSNQVQFGVWNWHSATSFDTFVIEHFSPENTGLMFIRITDDGTNRKYWASNNGLDYGLVRSEATNTYVTPNQAGIALYNGTGPQNMTVTIYHFLVTGSILPQFAA